MISRAFIDYNTCPIEAFDSLRIKKTLNLPSSTETNMLLECRLQEDTDVYEDRFRIPFEKAYLSINKPKKKRINQANKK